MVDVEEPLGESAKLAASLIFQLGLEQLEEVVVSGVKHSFRLGRYDCRPSRHDYRTLALGRFLAIPSACRRPAPRSPSRFCEASAASRAQPQRESQSLLEPFVTSLAGTSSSRFTL